MMEGWKKWLLSSICHVTPYHPSKHTEIKSKLLSTELHCTSSASSLILQVKVEHLQFEGLLFMLFLMLGSELAIMRCIVGRDVQCTNNKIINFTPSAGCLLCNAMLHTEVQLQVQRGFHNLVYWENSAVKSMPHTKYKRIKLETEGD